MKILTNDILCFMSTVLEGKEAIFTEELIYVSEDLAKLGDLSNATWLDIKDPEVGAMIIKRKELSQM